MRRRAGLHLVPCMAVLGLAHSALGNDIPREEYTDQAGTSRARPDAPRDAHGNAAGDQFDLARNGAFKGKRIAVIQLYDSEGFDFSLPGAALVKKGFELVHWKGGVPGLEDLQRELERASQLWVISTNQRLLTPSHHLAIREFFERGGGLYIFGDNDPWLADANALSLQLFGTMMSGNLQGEQVVGPRRRGAVSGFLDDHLLTTGIERLYEGHTVASLHSVEATPRLRPLLFGSAGNLIAAFHDQDGRRAIVDAAFTRLYRQWDEAGSARIVANAGGWLATGSRNPTALARRAPAAAPGSRPSTRPLGSTAAQQRR